MKKIIVLFLSIFTLFGCGEELEYNTPAFLGEKDGNLWEATSYRANISNSGVLTIVGSDNFETITLEVNSTELGIHDVVETTSFGSLRDIEDVLYSSNNTPDPSVQVYPASGQIDLKEVNVLEGYVSGEFYFNAFNSSGLTSINVNKGFFFKVPLLSVAVGSTGGADVNCATASAVVAATLINFNAASPGDVNYANVCNAYKTALTTQQVACGDDDGLIQDIIDGLSCI
ncbi:hypothetical protein CLV86_1239 [Lacinutrix venerupis]|uniref:DUF6252 family protein n=1 Tax=Lacinutrix venerupis TaxID=1486034 RepID=UPI000EB31A9A|nr:DUF6252 family protein [Lacinutrix venerupis]RLJ65662.1 hypothetical protein CLV86_1239 [Lacinutrix venerupis]